MDDNTSLIEMVEDETLLELLSRVAGAQENSEEHQNAERALATYGRDLGIRAKVDAYGHVRSYFQGQIHAAEMEMARLKARQDRYERQVKRLEQLAILALVMLPVRPGAKPQLHGEHTTLKLHDNPPRVNLVNEALIPDRYISVTVTFPLNHWMMQPTSGAGLSMRRSLRIADIRKDLIDGKTVPGAELENTMRVEML